MDPASWDDWLDEIWKRDGIVRARGAGEKNVKVTYSDGSEGVALIIQLMPTVFSGQGALPKALQKRPGAVISESAAFTIFSSYVNWSGHRVDSTVSSLLETLRGIQDDRAPRFVMSAWEGLLVDLVL